MRITLINDDLALDSEGNLWGRGPVWSNEENATVTIWMQFLPDPYPNGFYWLRPALHGGGRAKIDELTAKVPSSYRV